MKNRDGSDSNVKFVSESTKKKTKKKESTPVSKTTNRGMVSDAYKKSLAKAIAKGATGFKGIERLTDQDIARQFSVARGMVTKNDPSGRLSDQDVAYAAKKLKAKKKKVNPVAKGFAQDKRIRADKAKEKKAFSKKN